jgi:hypothetical protein
MAFYIPIPSNIWSRVRDEQCSITNENINGNELNSKYMIRKGNILQYKNNSTNLTKLQKYSQIAKGYKQSRTNAYATQSQTYTNPNIQNLNNVNGVLVPNHKNCPNIKCYPSSASNVPGNAQLCWSNKIQTIYPRQTRIMSTSTSSLATGYKNVTSAIHLIPQTLTGNIVNNELTLTWNINNENVINYNIYQNDNLIKTVKYPNNSLILNTTEPHIYYIISQNNHVTSLKSNIIFL